MTNRFKGLDLIDSVPDELRAEVHNTVQEAVIKTTPKKKKCKKTKWPSEEALQIAEKTKEKTLYMDITKWLIPKSDSLYTLQEKFYIVSKNKTRS